MSKWMQNTEVELYFSVVEPSGLRVLGVFSAVVPADNWRQEAEKMYKKIRHRNKLSVATEVDAVSDLGIHSIITRFK